MKTLRALAIGMLLLVAQICSAQNIYHTQFEGCNTDHFSMESDSTTAKLNGTEFVTKLQDAIGKKTCAKLRGEIKLQIIVDLNGNSCLISMENDTKLKPKDFDFKKFIDEEIHWQIPSKKVGPIIVLEFTKYGIGYRRLGMNGNRGWHFLE